MKNIEIDKIVTNALSGSHISECIKDCIELAIKEWRVVTLEHNSKIYRIDPEKICDFVSQPLSTKRGKK
jgi:hypothetical protein